MKNKKIINYISLTLIMLVLCNIKIDITYAAIAQNNKEAIQKISEEEAKKYVTDSALNWAEMMEPALKLKVDKVRRIKTSEKETEFMISFKSGKQNYGYAILKNENYDFIVNNGVIEENYKDLYKEIVGHIKSEKKNAKNIGKELVKISDREYGVCFEEGKDSLFYNNSGIITNDTSAIEVCSAKSYASDQTIFIDIKNWTTDKYKVVNPKTDSIILNKYKKRNRLFSSYEVAKITKKYACSVQALLQIAYMENICDGSVKSIKKIYEELWKRCKTKIIATDKTALKESGLKELTCGSNTIENAAKGFVSYAKSLGYNTAYKGEEKNPSVAWIKDKLKYNRPIIMGYTINVKEGNNVRKSSHAISVLGWIKATKLTSKKSYNYLLVYDGWSNTQKYLNYTTVDFSQYCSASYFWLKK